jgi:hypothetical protein
VNLQGLALAIRFSDQVFVSKTNREYHSFNSGSTQIIDAAETVPRNGRSYRVRRGLCSWLASLLLGTLNIEQTKFLKGRHGAAIALGGALSASPAPGIGTARDAGELSRAGLLQCPVLRSRRAERLLLRSAYQAVHRPGECSKDGVARQTRRCTATLSTRRRSGLISSALGA